MDTSEKKTRDWESNTQMMPAVIKTVMTADSHKKLSIIFSDSLKAGNWLYVLRSTFYALRLEGFGYQTITVRGLGDLGFLPVHSGTRPPER